MHINAQSLCKHHDEILAIFSETNVHIIMISESLKPSISSNIVAIPGYTIVRQDRNILTEKGTNKSGGAVAMYIRNDLKHKVVHSSAAESTGLEFLFVEIRLGVKRCLAIVVYWPPKTGTLKVLEEHLSAV